MKKLTNKKLHTMLYEPDQTALKNYCLNYLSKNFSNSKERETFINDLMQYGCQSGMVSELIYYSDTKEFFRVYFEDIFELVEELEESTGEPLPTKGIKYNFYAWLGFEETMRSIFEYE